MNAGSASYAPLTLAISPSGGEGIETAPSPSESERVGMRVAHVFTHNPGQRMAEWARFETTSIRWLCQGSGTRLLVRYAKDTPESGSAQQ